MDFTAKADVLLKLLQKTTWFSVISH